MDIIDEAQSRNDHFLKLAIENRVFDMAPLPPGKTNNHGEPLCIDCSANISQRRQILPHTQRCIDCQQWQEITQKKLRGK